MAYPNLYLDCKSRPLALRASFSSRTTLHLESGGALLEFALTLPLILLLLVMGINTSALLGQYLEVSNLAYQSSRIAMQTPGISLHTAAQKFSDKDPVGVGLHHDISNLISKSEVPGASFSTALSRESPNDPPLLEIKIQRSVQLPFPAMSMGIETLTVRKRSRYLYRN